MEKNRMENLSDGVFAIVITLPILFIKFPDFKPEAYEGRMHQYMMSLIPILLSYLLTFWIIGILWHFHHTIFSFIRRMDPVIMWLNLVYLLFVAFLPFTTGLLAVFSSKLFPLILYSAVLVLTGVSRSLLLCYIYRRPDLAMSKDVLGRVYYNLRISMFGPAVHLAAIAFAFLSVVVSYVLLALVPLLYMLIRYPKHQDGD